MTAMQERGKLRKREVVFAVAAGALAAGGAALVLEMQEGPAPVEAVAAGPDELAYEVAPFEEISSVGPQDVIVTYGESFEVRSEGSPERLAQLEAIVERDRLIIRPKGGNMAGFNWFSDASATFYVTLPRLKAFSMRGSGDVEIDRVEGESFEASLAGSGELSIAEMRVDRAEFTLAGSGSVEAAGRAGDTRVSITGSGEIDARDLTSGTAWVSMAGSGDASLTVEDEARVSVVGSGDVDISGPARCTVSRMGSGDVRCSSGD